MEKSGYRVLVVEDSSVDSRFLAKTLEEIGYEVIGFATKGEEAVELSKKTRPDLVLMDIELEGSISGIEASGTIINDLNIPIVYTTAYSDPETIEKVKQLSPYGYLIKPYDKKSLYVSVELAIHRHDFYKKLKDSEKRYRGLFEESRDAIYIRNNKGQFVDFNESMVKLFGYERDELMKLSIHDLAVYKDDIKEFESQISGNGYVEDFEIQLLKKDGSVLTCLITGNTIESIDNELKGCQAHIKDITEKKILSEKIFLSEEKYRILIEGSNDIIFSLDKDWNFITINKAVNKHLNINAKDIISKPFVDILYDGNGEQQISKQIIIEKLEKFKKERAPVYFNANFKSPISSEPKEMQVKLEYINFEGKSEILGVASQMLEDALMNHFISENLRFEIGNFLITAEDVSHRVTRNLVKYMDHKEINLLRIALREIIINAIEHGNLDISFEEKTRALEKDEYVELIYSRQNDPKNRTKKVVVEYSLNPDKVVYKIADEGVGFDFKSILNDEKNDINTKLLPHGRGLKMAKNIFDEIIFNEKGNEVLLSKKF